MSLADSQLLEFDDPVPFKAGTADRSGCGVLVVCDHASNAIPRSLGSLGIGENALKDHIAYDIGAGGVAAQLVKELGAGFVFGAYSRLVADPNRSPRDASVIPRISDGVLIPGNLNLSAAQHDARIRFVHTPYHEAVDRATAALVEAGVEPVIVAVHSFTPSISGIPRPWHTVVLWDKDARLAIPLLAALRRERDLIVGDNEPYSGRHPADYTIDRHAEGGGFAHAAIEIRQDLITTATEQRDWGVRLGRVLRSILDAAGSLGTRQ